MLQRKLLWICIPALVFFMIAGFLGNGKIPDLSVSWPENESLLVEGRIYQAGHTANASTIYLKNISVLSESDEPLSQLTKEYLKKSNILVYLKEDTDIAIGDFVQVSGICMYPHAPTNPGGFDGRSYYAAQNICMMLRKGVIKKHSESPLLLKNAAYQFHQKISSVLESASSDVEGAVLRSLLLGDRSGLETEVKQLYQQNGIIHVLAISGLHISIIGMSLYSFLRKRSLTFHASSAISFSLILVYGFMTGFPTSAIRAILMFGIYLGSQILGRTYDLLNSLALTAVIMLCTNPLLITQSGFQLSFGAVLGVMACRFFRSHLLSDTSFGVSFSVWLMTLPITAFTFFQVPVSGILLNLFVVPSMSVIIVLGIIGTVLLFFSDIVGTFVFGPVHYILKFTLFLCDMVRRIPGAVWITGRPSVVRILLYYLILYGGLAYLQKKDSVVAKVMRGGLVLLSVALLLLPLNQGFSITFLDVGQGDGTCIHSDSGAVYMVDGGSSSESKIGQYTLEPYLKCMGYRNVDGWFISHYDSDHVNGLIEILQGYTPDLCGNNAAGITIRRLILPQLDTDPETEEDLQKELLLLAKKNRIPVRYVSRFDHFQDQNTSFDIYNPVKGRVYKDSNEGSMVMKVSYDDLSILMTGDVQENGEKDLMEIDMGEIDILKVAHHGSKNSSGMEILEHISPKLAIISVGAGNRYGHPSQEVLDNLKKTGCKVRRTDEEGAIIIEK